MGDDDGSISWYKQAPAIMPIELPSQYSHSRAVIAVVEENL
jgi:hypothetical protein